MSDENFQLMYLKHVLLEIRTRKHTNVQFYSEIALSIAATIISMIDRGSETPLTVIETQFT
jgi:hypothetical protein